MPLMDGNEMIEKIRSHNKKIPIIILTGTEKAKEHSKTTIIHKPFDASTLKNTVEELIR